MIFLKLVYIICIKHSVHTRKHTYSWIGLGGRDVTVIWQGGVTLVRCRTGCVSIDAALLRKYMLVLIAHLRQTGADVVLRAHLRQSGTDMVLLGGAGDVRGAVVSPTTVMCMLTRTQRWNAIPEFETSIMDSLPNIRTKPYKASI